MILTVAFSFKALLKIPMTEAGEQTGYMISCSDIDESFKKIPNKDIVICH
ncbi:hypothetical protein SAMN05421856_102403 [Chryseobacterium taichungense]|uniref:Uncharacterized protein n=1 Tax=Chryseobacterium taichungense TaxID=295069 RepID=A0A1H7XGP0_9FLAO|nr:hypothetical protein SAMN05421856_102403 [Chryseobacterium taichungense]